MPPSQPPEKAFALKLYSARLKSGLTQKQFAKHLYGMPWRTYQDLEAGRRETSPWTEKALLAALKAIPKNNPKKV